MFCKNANLIIVNGNRGVNLGNELLEAVIGVKMAILSALLPFDTALSIGPRLIHNDYLALRSRMGALILGSELISVWPKTAEQSCGP
jgi:hypothetical protein